MRGRRPSGPNYVKDLQGCELAKERVRIVLEIVKGGLSVQEACLMLGIKPARFYQLRREVLQGVSAAVMK